MDQEGCVMWAGIFSVPEATGKNVRVASTINLIALKQIKPPTSSGKTCWWLSPSASPPTPHIHCWLIANVHASRQRGEHLCPAGVLYIVLCSLRKVETSGNVASNATGFQTHVSVTHLSAIFVNGLKVSENFPRWKPNAVSMDVEGKSP